TAQRRGNVCRMGAQHIRNGCIYVRQQKTGTELLIPISSELATVFAVTPATLTFLTTERGTPFDPNDFGRWFRRQCDAAGLPKHCVPHGLRHAAASRLAEAGASTNQIAAITGHTSLREVARYTQAADRTRMAKQAAELMANTSVTNIRKR